MTKHNKYGFIIHPEEWKMVRDVLTEKQIADGLFKVLDACLIAEDPGQSIGSTIKTDLCARLFWDRNVRDIAKYAENIEQSTERKRRFRESKERNGTVGNALERSGTVGNAVERNGTQRNGMERSGTLWNATERSGTQKNAGNAHYTNTNTNTYPNTYSNNRSVTVTVTGDEPNGNGNGTVDLKMEGGIAEAKKRGHEFSEAAKVDSGAFFDPVFDPVTICATVTGDWKSLKRWRQLAIEKGDSEVREEVFAFWREIASGEDVDNRGAALNARLAALGDKKA